MKNNHTRLTDKELGTVEAVLLDFNNHRLPSLLRIKDRVDNGATLEDYEIDFLAETFEHSRGSDHFADIHPEFRKLVSQVADLYHHITSKALENEKK
ncbi:hypothetical protein [Agarilytica rhodophyticola]|uniref:hypothetical protein n=1 Tax=Agarilytica rhodophyticola TaxID=1737490 RepID=UPI000B34701A|nr:hypothetical protein [Agarilytica rhodophyticola]